MHYGEIKNCDIANGIGVRVSLFVSGCTNHCEGCFQPETWDFNYGNDFTEETENRILEIESVKFFKQFAILKFRGIDTIDEAEKYRRKSLYVTRENAVRLQKDEYFIADLIGVKVLDEQEQELGTLEDVIETGANDVYQIRLKDGRQLLLPAIKECVLDVDVEAGRMKIHILDGLLED